MCGKVLYGSVYYHHKYVCIEGVDNGIRDKKERCRFIHKTHPHQSPQFHTHYTQSYTETDI